MQKFCELFRSRVMSYPEGGHSRQNRRNVDVESCPIGKCCKLLIKVIPFASIPKQPIKSAKVVCQLRDTQTPRLQRTLKMLRYSRIALSQQGVHIELVILLVLRLDQER